MIDSVLRQKIIRAAAVAFEGIAPDYLETPEPTAEDAVEPSVWNMTYDQVDEDVLKIAEKYDHPDRQEFLAICLESIQRYF